MGLGEGAIKLAKHGVTFEAAELVSYDPRALIQKIVSTEVNKDGLPSASLTVKNFSLSLTSYAAKMISKSSD